MNNKNKKHEDALSFLTDIFSSKNPYDLANKAHNPVEPVEGRGNWTVTPSDFGDADVDSDSNE